MKLFKQFNGFFRQNMYKGRKNGFVFEIYPYLSGWYCTVEHTKKDIRFNTLWIKFAFRELEDALAWCEAFRPENFECLGTGELEEKNDL